MRKTLIAIAAILVVGVAGLLGYAAMQPDEFRIERTASIDAPPEKIYAILSDLRRGVEWSPFEKTDPDMKRSYSGAERGEGAAYAWDGDSNAGAGRMEIVEATEPSRLVLSLDFTHPMEAHNTVEYTLADQGDATSLTWAMHGPTPFISKVMCLFFDMDEMVGGMFEQGLASLKKLAEAENKTAAR